MTDLNGKTVLVTGAGGGFGKHLVEQLLERHCTLIVTDLDAELLSLPGPPGNSGEIVLSHPADLSSATSCREFAQRCAAAGRVPDVLINNAGIAVLGRHDRVPARRWERLMALNLLAPMRLTGLFLPAMIARGGGHIVNISSLAGWIGGPHLSAYAASKFGLRGFGEALAAEVGRNNIQVSTVYPSISRTPILDSDQFGMGKRLHVPERMLSEPADVVANILHGVERNRVHIFPDRTARRAHYVKRFFPWAIPLITQRMQSNMSSGNG